MPLGSVRTDKPAPYVQAIEEGKVVHKTIEAGARGTAGNENVVAVKGLAEGTQVIRANIGYLREGTQVRFTQLAAPVAPASSTTAK